MSIVRRALPYLLLIMFVATPVARADIFFLTNDLWPALWQYPAAVAIDDWPFLWRGVIWSEPSAVKFGYTEGGPVYQETVGAFPAVGPIVAACDGVAQVHACFQARIGGDGLRYAFRTTGGPWTSEWITTGANKGWYCAIGVLQDTAPVVAYVDASVVNNDVLIYAVRGQPGWLMQVLDTSGLGEPRLYSVSLATDRQLAVHVAWIRGREVRYCRGPGTPIEVVLLGVSPMTVSAGIARDGQPRLAILDSGSLRYATRTESGWTVEPVLPVRTSVRELSMAVGFEGVPHIAFVTDNPDDPVLLATLFRGAWREQPLTETPTYGVIQKPSLSAGSGTYWQNHLVAAWNGAGLQLSFDEPFLPAFAVARLRASPLGDLTSTVELYNGVQQSLPGTTFHLDFTAPGVWDTVNFCQNWRDTLRSWTDGNGTATFRLATGGAVTGGIAIKATVAGLPEPLLIERSLPLAGVDLEGNGSVTPIDRELFDELLGGTDPRADLDFNGVVDAQDRQYLLDRLGQACTLSGVAPETGTAEGLALALHPNPASGTTTVSWRQTATAHVRIAVYDLAGRRVRELVVAQAQAGTRTVAWDGRDDAGRAVAGGVYLVRLETGGSSAMRRVVRVR